MKALKNHTMLEELKLSPNELLLKQFRAKYLDACRAPVGHVYTLMVEELNIAHPNISEFIQKLNEILFNRGNGHVVIKDPTDIFFDKIVYALGDYLRRYFTSVYEEKHRKILNSAVGYECWKR